MLALVVLASCTSTAPAPHRSSAWPERCVRAVERARLDANDAVLVGAPIDQTPTELRLRVDVRPSRGGYDPGDFFEAAVRRIATDEPSRACLAPPDQWQVPCSRPNHGAPQIEVLRRVGDREGRVVAHRDADFDTSGSSWDGAVTVFERALDVCLDTHR
jgi:hypothetical protein